MNPCPEDSTAYWKGLWHGLLLMLPVITFLYRKWSVAAEKTTVQQPVIGAFMNELFAFEVVMVAGAELKAVRDQLKSAEEATPVNEKKVKALKERVVDVATVLQTKLETITPIVSFLMEQSVGVIKDHHADKISATAEEETKKDK
ncbi:hypothetical protein BBJ29_002283 [Phytophthora kernoviae]|uniref:Uncharacterized protein n=1 Tax=Phytophthora kernoviae TaxID=325452 RepID=A0A3F2RY64_9STRA|nr:hypothetical protein BBP00_00002204 [Phytophthora kernoviae]RLN70334.1 hypothetical protein BBJ29_002283 [Phytophthora kernoviae]